MITFIINVLLILTALAIAVEIVAGICTGLFLKAGHPWRVWLEDRGWVRRGGGR